MKKLILSCFILLLTLVSCSPKQKNKNEEKVIIFNDESTRYISESEYIGMIVGRDLSGITVETLEKRSKVIFKGFAGEPPYYNDISLVTYNGVDIYLETSNLSNLEVTMIRDDKIIEFDYNYYYNQDKIKVYKKCNKKSESFFVTKKELRFHRIKGIKDWLYLSADYLEDNNFGFVYLYDISKKSFYGNFYENKKSRNKYRMTLNSEYEVIKRHKNIKRYGPLLTINHNGKTIEFWNFFSPSDYQIIKYLLLDYYLKYNEILISRHYYENGDYFIYNLESGNICSYGIPYFNRSRTYTISVSDNGHYGINLRVYAIKNGLYTMLKKIEFDYQEIEDIIGIKNVVWLNDTNAQINFDNSSSMLVEIGKEVKLHTNNRRT